MRTLKKIGKKIGTKLMPISIWSEWGFIKFIPNNFPFLSTEIQLTHHMTLVLSYSIVIRKAYMFLSAHHDMCCHHLPPYSITTILLTLFPALHFHLCDLLSLLLEVCAS